MGFFKDVSTLKHQGREMQKHTDVKASMANGMARMQAANAMMQQQTAASMMAIQGQDATATISGLRQTGMQVNFAPVIDIDLTVFRNGIPMPATVRETVQQMYLGRCRIGENLKVKVDPNNPALVWIDWIAPA